MDAPGKVPDSIGCHACGAVQDLTGQTAFTHAECFRCGALIVVPLQFANFMLLNPMGIGGMGTVYKAIDMSLNRPLALKILRKKVAANPDFIENFSREARAAASVNHPNIAQVYSFAEQDGQYYLAMELLERGSLDDRITKLGQVPERDLLHIASQIASGLRAAYQRGLLHRDIKPGNILFSDQGAPKIVDFGLARAQAVLGEGAPPPGASEPIWGTPYYIAPEKLRGQPEDFRSDMYSLGATLFHALAGRPPFEADTVGEVVTKHATQPALSLKTFAPATHDFTAHVIARMLAKNPAERYESYDDLIRDLEEALRQVKASEAAPAIVVATGERIPLLSIIGTAATVVLAVLIVMYVWVKFLRPQVVTAPATAGAPGIATPTPATGTGTTAVGTTTAPAPVAEEVNFREDSPWVKTWETATLQLTLGRYQDALWGYETALSQAGKVRPAAREWIYYYQGLTSLAQDQPGQASDCFKRGFNAQLLGPDTPHPIPEEITTANFANVLRLTMLGNIPLAELEAAISRMQPWAVAQTRLVAGFKHMTAGEFDKAAESFREYQKMPRDDQQQWAFNLNPLAERLAKDCDGAARVLSEIDALQKEQKYKEAFEKLNAATTSTKLTALKAALLARKPALQATLDNQSEQLKAAEDEAEQQRKDREESDRVRAQEEARLLQKVEPGLAPLWQVYDFKGALAKYEAFAVNVQTAEGRRVLEPRIALARLLVDFKTQLAADFARQPYDGTKLTTRTDSQLSGRLVRATDSSLVFATPYGELLTDWRDLAPGTLRGLAESYATASAPTEKAEAQARRYLLLAAYCKQYGLDRWAAGYSQQATKLYPALQEQVNLIFGKTSS